MKISRRSVLCYSGLTAALLALSAGLRAGHVVLVAPAADLRAAGAASAA